MIPNLASKRLLLFLTLLAPSTAGLLFAQMPPPNDKCMNQTPVGEGTFIFCTDFATTTDYFVGSLKSSGFNFYGIKDDVFFCYTATALGTLKVGVSAFPGFAIGLATPCDCSTASPVAVLESCTTGLTTGIISASVMPGDQILIRVGSCDGSTGMGSLIITCEPTKPNDRCEAPNLVFDGGSEAIDFTNITLDGPDPVGTLGADLWYSYTPRCNEAVTFSACTMPPDTTIAVYGSQTSCPMAVELIAFQTSTCAATVPPLTVNLLEGQTYQVQVGAMLGTTPTGTLEVTALNLLAPPTNDDCASALPIGNGVHAFDTRCATTSLPGGEPACDFFGDDQVLNDIWFEYTAACSETLFLDLSNSQYDTKVAVHTSCGAATSPLACNDDSNHSVTSMLSFQTAAGQSYWVRVGGYLGSTGIGELRVGCATPMAPVNDSYTSPLPISDGLTAFTNRGGTTDGPESCECDPKKDVWHRYVATSDCELTVSLCGSSFDTYLGVYPEPSPGAMLAPGDELACVDDFCSYQSEVTVTVSAGQAVLLRVGGWNDIEGDGQIFIDCQPLVPSFVRGRCNTDAAFDISDAIFLVNYLFQGAATPSCENACDANDDGLLNIADIVALLSGLFAAPPLPLPPPAACGPDPTPSLGVSCSSFPGC